MKIVEVADTTSVEPQEVPGFDGTFPRPLKDSEHTEREWVALGFHVREVKPSDPPAKDEGTAVEAVVAEGGE